MLEERSEDPADLDHGARSHAVPDNHLRKVAELVAVDPYPRALNADPGREDDRAIDVYGPADLEREPYLCAAT